MLAHVLPQHAFTIRRFARTAIDALTEILRVFVDAHILQIAAATSFYALLALGPLVLVVMSIAGFLFGDVAVRGEVFSSLTDTIGAAGAEFVEGLVLRSAGRGQGLAAAVGGVLFLWSAGGVFAQMRDGMAQVRHTAAPALAGPDPPALSVWRALLGGTWRYMHGRLLSVGVVLVAAGALVLAIVASSVASVATSMLPSLNGAWVWGNTLLTGAILTGLSALLYRLLAAPPLPRGSALLGGAVAAVVFLVGRSFIAVLVGWLATESAFGAAASVIAVLLWAWFSATTLLLGCTVGAVHERKRIEQRA